MRYGCITSGATVTVCCFKQKPISLNTDPSIVSGVEGVQMIIVTDVDIPLRVQCPALLHCTCTFTSTFLHVTSNVKILLMAGQVEVRTFKLTLATV